MMATRRGYLRIGVELTSRTDMGMLVKVSVQVCAGRRAGGRVAWGCSARDADWDRGLALDRRDEPVQLNGSKKKQAQEKNQQRKSQKRSCRSPLCGLA